MEMTKEPCGLTLALLTTCLKSLQAVIVVFSPNCSGLLHLCTVSICNKIVVVILSGILYNCSGGEIIGVVWCRTWDLDRVLG